MYQHICRYKTKTYIGFKILFLRKWSPYGVELNNSVVSLIVLPFK